MTKRMIWKPIEVLGTVNVGGELPVVSSDMASAEWRMCALIEVDDEPPPQKTIDDYQAVYAYYIAQAERDEARITELTQQLAAATQRAESVRVPSDGVVAVMRRALKDAQSDIALKVRYYEDPRQAWDHIDVALAWLDSLTAQATGQGVDE